MAVTWIVESGSDKPTTVEGVSGVAYGADTICPCSVKFLLPGRRVKEEPVVAKADYDSEAYVKIENVRVVPPDTVVFDAIFKAFPRQLHFDVRAWTETESGLDPGGTGKVVCTLEVAPYPEEPPPEREQLLDKVLFINRDMQGTVDGVLKLNSPNDRFDLLFHEFIYRERLTRLDEVIIVPTEKRHPHDPYQGPKVTDSRMINDGSGVRLLIKDTMPRTNYLLTVKGRSVFGSVEWILVATTKE